MSDVPSNLIPTRVTQLPTAPVADENSLMMIVYQGNNYQIRVGDLLSVAGVPTSRQVIAGTGLTGGGALSSNVTLSVANGGIGTTQLAASGVTPGTYGDATNIPVFIVDSTGRVTAATTVPASGGGGVPTTREVIAGTGLNGGGALSSNVTLNANLSSATPLAVNTTGSAGVSTDIARADHQHPAIDLADDDQVDGLLGLDNGGTGRSLVPEAGAIVWSGADGLYIGPAGAVGQVLVSNGANEYYWANTPTDGPQPAHYVYIGPSSGGPAAPNYRLLVSDDLPVAIDNKQITSSTINSTSIGASSPSTGVFTTVDATDVTASLVDATNVETSNIKAKDGTASATIADTTGLMTIASSVLTTTDINGGNIDNTVIGATTPVAGSFTNLAAERIDMDTTPPAQADAEGRMYWNSDDNAKTLNIGMAGGTVVQQVGEEIYYRVKASAAISNGQTVMFTGTVGASGGLLAAPATGLTATNADYYMGVATEDIALNGWGYITQFGVVRGINTTGGAEAWVDGQTLYYNPAVPGGLTKTVPVAPAAKIEVASVIHAASNGSLFVRAEIGFRLSRLNDVETGTPTIGDLLQYTAGNYWTHTPSANVSVGEATNLAGGAANKIAYQTAADTTSFIDAPTVANTFLEWSGSAYQWSTNPLGTVTSVGLSLPSEFNITNSPVTSSGTLTGSWSNQTANYVLAAPNGSFGTPTFRAIVAADIPTLNQNTTGSAGSVVNAVTFSNTSGGVVNSTFNGSSTLTVDYSTVGAPKADGTGASGSWGISITGNAATATSATSATSATTATNIAGGAAGSVPYQTGSGATSLLPAGTGVLVGGATPSYTTTPTLTGTNFSAIPNAALTNSSVTIGSTSVALGATASSLAGLSSVTLTGDPTTALQAATKQYVDTLAASGIHFHDPVRVESPNTAGNLNATYNNGASGVGATLTNAGTQTALVIDGVTLNTNDRVLIYNQTNQYENGVYTVTNTGSGSTNWVLTRATDADTYSPFSPNSLGQGDAFFVTSGDTGAGETYICNTVGTITFGTTAITFAQVSSAQVYSAGTGLTLTGTQFSLTTPVSASNGGVGQSSYTTGDIIYATGSTTLSKLGIGASSRIMTSTGSAPTWTNPASVTVGSATTATSATSATTATTATNIAGGAANRIAYNTGSGATSFVVAPTVANTYLEWSGSAFQWSSNPLGSVTSVNVSGGTTGLTTSGGPITSSGTITLAGTLAVANGGTGATTAGGALTSLGAYPATNPSGYTSNTGTVTSVTGGSYLTGGTITTSGTLAVDATSANTASKVVARDASGNFSAGTITASLSGNATTATTATNQSGGTVNATTGAFSSTLSVTGTTTVNNYINRITAQGNSAWLQQDGTGRVHWYWNTLGGTSPTFTNGSEDAAAASLTANNGGAGGAFFTRSASGVGKSAGDPITWTTTLYADLNTLSYKGNTVLRSDNYNSYAPTLTGTGASGTWGISISGNAATATTASATSATLTRGTYLTGSNFNGSAATTWAVDATSANTASKVVARDASGNFAAGQITATSYVGMNGGTF